MDVNYWRKAIRDDNTSHVSTAFCCLRQGGADILMTMHQSGELEKLLKAKKA